MTKRKAEPARSVQPVVSPAAARVLDRIPDAAWVSALQFHDVPGVVALLAELGAAGRLEVRNDHGFAEYRKAGT